MLHSKKCADLTVPELKFYARKNIETYPHYSSEEFMSR